MSLARTGRLQAGTAIATFSDRGRYESNKHGNHACFFIRFDGIVGILVLEQHVPPNFGLIQTRTIRSRGSNRIGISPSDTAEAFSVIL
jgi:hypothetical protein